MEQLVYKKPDSIKDDFKISFCPGCDHGVAVRLVAEVLDELGVREETIGIASVGCSVFSYDFFNVDVIEAPHGRSLAVATGVKRSKPNKVVFTYQGDGDLASIGIGETIHAMTRGEKVTTICINNTTYGMTGGQGGPTTLLGQVTTTTPQGRKVEVSGYPLKVSESLAHEVMHSIQHINGMLGAPEKSLVEKVTVSKLMELSSKLAEILVRDQIGKLPKYRHLTPDGRVVSFRKIKNFNWIVN